MKIKRLLNKLDIKIDVLYNHKINDFKEHSKEVVLNDVFFSIPSFSNPGSDYIEEAISKGAKTVFYQGSVNKVYSDVNYVEVENVNVVLAKAVLYFYNNITSKVKLIGVTGTNGKSTCTNLIYDYMCYEGLDPLLIGTSGVYFLDEHYPLNNTTPSLLSLTKIILEAYKKDVKYVIMEVSSIGIRELRVMYFDFDYVLLTNLTHDHLDYHKSIVDYKFSKGLLINQIPYHKDKYIFLNKDSEYFDFYYSLAKTNVVTFGLNDNCDFQAINILKNLNETAFRLLHDHKKYMIKSSLVGGFNVYNITSSIAVLSKLGFNISQVIEFLKIYVNLSGRMDVLKYKDKTIVIDFAHTPDGVKNVLRSLKEYNTKKLTTIVGCGGNRDTQKRHIIGSIACSLSDKVIFTNDNPRDEDASSIIDDITGNLTYQNYDIILDRKEAIYSAINNSIKDEIIAILGKGAETHQIILGIKYPFNDKEVVKQYIKEHNN